jgi:predicted outer membrane repeat protein
MFRSNFRRAILCLVVFSGALGSAGAAVWLVPDHFPTIQSALSDGAVTNNDTIVVKAGTYPERIDFLGKSLSLRSLDGPEVTIINGGQAGSVVTFAGGEGPNAVLKGFTITNGRATNGGGIYCVNGSSPTIEGNIISGNTATSRGGGIYTDQSSSLITDNLIQGNTATDQHGGGVSLEEGAPTITGNTFIANTCGLYGGGLTAHFVDSGSISDNLFMDNLAHQGGGGLRLHASSVPVENNILAANTSMGDGGGIYTFGSPAPITNNTIVANHAYYNNAGLYCSGTGAIVTNCIFWNNTPNQIGGSPTVTYCDVEGGWSGTGNIDSDPLFVSPAQHDYHLSFSSPCKNVGDSTAPGLPDKDFEGDPRVTSNVVDMGADEFYQHLYQRGDAVPGNSIDIVVTGTPGKSPVTLLLGSGVLNAPQQCPYGLLRIELPILFQMNLGKIPANGVIEIAPTVPSNWQSGSEYPFQALVGLSYPGPELTNLMVIEVE